MDGNRTVFIAGETLNRGQRVAIDREVTRLPTGTWLTLPMHVICGKEPGPNVWLTATIHGEELNGLEVIHQVLQRLDAQKFAGVLLAVPVMNVLGFMSQTRTFPDGSDLNRSFPGAGNGRIAEQLAHYFMNEVVEHCEYGIDLHSGANHRLNPPQIRADLCDPQTRVLAESFAAPFMMHAPDRKGSLRAAAIEAGNRVLLFEGGEPLRRNDDSVRAGTQGVLRVLHSLGMLHEAPEPAQRASIELTDDATWIKAPRCGILRLNIQVKDEVQEGDCLGEVSDVLGDRPEYLTAPFAGIVIGVSLNPFVAKDGGVVHIAKPASETTR